MKKLSVKLIGGLIIAIMLLQTSTVFATSTKDKIDQQTNAQSENNKKINDAKSNLSDVQEQKSDAQDQVNDLATKISTYQAQIDELDDKIDDLNNKITDSQNKLNQKQEDFEKQEDLLEKRLVTIQEAGDTSYLDFLLSSDGITDLISNYYLASEVATADTELLEKIQNEKKEIEQAKEELENSKKELDTSKAEKQGVSTQLQEAKKEKSAQVAKLADDEKAIQEEIDALQEANVQIAKEIKANQAKYAAELKALENQQKNNNSSSGNKNNSNSGSNNSGSNGNYNSGGSGRLQRPVSSGSVTAGMYYPSGSYHGAIDYGVPAGTPVYAADAGVVIKTANLTYSYGTYVVIQHIGGLQTWYAHGTSGSICVSEGQTVSRGQQIMRSGNSGHSTGAHLHFEVRVAPYDYNTCRVNPANYM